MSRMTRTLKALQRELKNAKQSSNDAVESSQPLDISSIERASFFQGYQYSPHGNPLHSTALEEDLSPGPEQNQKSAPETIGRPRAGKCALGVMDTDKTTVTQAKKISKAVSEALNNKASSKENQEPHQVKSSQVCFIVNSSTCTVHTYRESRLRYSQTCQTTNKGEKSVVRRGKGRPLPTISEGREDAGKKRTSIPTSYTANEAVKGRRSVKESSLTLGAAQRQQRLPPSSEDLTDEEESFHPSMEKSKRRASSQRQSGQKQKRKSSSSSVSRSLSLSKSKCELHLSKSIAKIFDSGFCRETINSEAVKRSIDAVGRSFEEQLSEIARLFFRHFHINSTINQKRTRLVEAINELIKGKTKLRNLQKDHDEMEQRLKALREGSSLLTHLQELNRKYMKHSTAHPDEVEMYGPSCMPAMLMEARCIMGTEHQLKTVNDHLQQVFDETEN
ncbi:centromere protein U [Carassius gibelio]|uniref:centromere protein U n=1 Tax=Carassius gibelio TaxID=101364 RepID=UPI002277AEB5|nr:centromere protein U [Carassius gibelio]